MDSGLLVTQDTRQVTLLNNFTQAARQPGTLYVNVESLPMYLSTSIAFSIFSYKLKSYPRPIVWRSVNEDPAIRQDVLEVLQTASIQVDSTYTPVASIPETKPTPARPSLQTKLPETPLKALPQPNIPETKPQSPSFTEASGADFDYDFNAVFSEAAAEVNAQEALNQNVSQDSTGANQPRQSSLHEFDKWIGKIEATKVALDKMKTAPAQTERIRVPEAEQIPTAKQPKTFLFLSTLFSGAVGLLAALVLFPNTVYTVSVTPAVREERIELSIPTTAFATQTVTLTEEASTLTSGSEGEEISRAVGRVEIVNRTGEAIELEQGQYYFETQGRRYVLLSNETLPPRITLPAQNQEPVGLPVQATEAGVEFGLERGVELELLDLLGRPLCQDCVVRVSEQIQATEQVGNRFVTSADQEVLRSTIDSLIAQERANTYEQLGGSATIGNSGWFQNVESEYVFDHAVGESAEELTLKVEVQTELYYLPRTDLSAVLQKENPAAVSIRDIQLVDNQGTFQNNEPISLTLLYRYEEETDLDREIIRERLEDLETPEAQASIQKDFPAVRRISKQNTGVAIPGVKPRINLNIVRTDAGE